MRSELLSEPDLGGWDGWYRMVTTVAHWTPKNVALTIRQNHRVFGSCRLTNHYTKVGFVINGIVFYEEDP